MRGQLDLACNPASKIAALTLSQRGCLTWAVLLITRETVPTETFASRATSLIVAIDSLRVDLWSAYQGKHIK